MNKFVSLGNDFSPDGGTELAITRGISSARPALAAITKISKSRYFNWLCHAMKPIFPEVPANESSYGGILVSPEDLERAKVHFIQLGTMS